MDRLTKQQRSFLMSRIRDKNTKPEMAIRRFIWGHGFRYRLHDRRLPGRPDIVFTAKRKVVFVHGCFWHGHHCRKTTPKTNQKFWQKKICQNRDRDRRNETELRQLKWRILTIWECQVGNPDTEKRLLKFLRT